MAEVREYEGQDGTRRVRMEGEYDALDKPQFTLEHAGLAVEGHALRVRQRQPRAAGGHAR